VSDLGTPAQSIADGSLDAALQRMDALRVLSLALASQGLLDVNAASLLRDIEEGGYTLRLTTNEERLAHNQHGESA